MLDPDLSSLNEWDRREVRALLRFAGKTRLEDITSMDIDAFIPSRSESHRSHRYLRRDLHRAFAAAGVEPNPTGLGPVRRAPRIEDFDETIQADIRQLLLHLEEQQFHRTTKEQYRKLALGLAEWVAGHPTHASKGLAAALLDDEVAREWAKWMARPMEGGRPRSVSTFAWVEHFLPHVWLASGMSRPDVEDKIDRLARSFRRSGRRRGKPDLLNLRDPDPAPPPSPDEVNRYLAGLDAAIASERSSTLIPTDKLRELLWRRAWLYTVLYTGMRRASLASMRVELLRPNERNVWGAWVIVKATPRRIRAAPTQRERIGDQTYGLWPIPAFLIGMYQEMFEANGLDLLDYLQTRRRDAVRWVSLDEDETFGRRAPIGTEVAPLWIDWRGDGYLPQHQFERAATRVVRRGLRLPRGRLHIFRGTAAVRNRELSVTNPGLVEKLLQMSPMQQIFYALPVQQDMVAALGAFDPSTEAPPVTPLRPAESPDLAELGGESANGFGDSAANPPPRRGGMDRRPRETPDLTLDDLFGDAD